MKYKFNGTFFLLLGFVSNAANIGLGQEAASPTTLMILETASDLATVGRLKDALRIVNFVQAMPGLTNRESAECQAVLKQCESLAIKFHETKSLGGEALPLRGGTDVGAMRIGARLVHVEVESSHQLTETEDDGADEASTARVVAGPPDADSMRLNPFEWVAVDKPELRQPVNRSISKNEQSDLRVASEEPRLLTPNSELRTVFEVDEPVQNPPGLFADVPIPESDAHISNSFEQGFARVNFDATPIALSDPHHATVSGVPDFEASPVQGRDNGQSIAFDWNSRFDLRWTVLIAGVAIGLLPTAVFRMAVSLRKRIHFRLPESRGAQPCGGNPTVANSDSFFSQIVEENQRIQR